MVVLYVLCWWCILARHPERGRWHSYAMIKPIRRKKLIRYISDPYARLICSTQDAENDPWGKGHGPSVSRSKHLKDKHYVQNKRNISIGVGSKPIIISEYGGGFVPPPPPCPEGVKTKW